MKLSFRAIAAFALLAMFGAVANADDEDKYGETIKMFQDAGESGAYFGSAYGYAIFPTIGKAGLGVGGAHGKGKVYRGGQVVGKTTMNQLSFGWQAGAQGYSLIMFFEDERAFNEFTAGNFEFGAKASAVAITAGDHGRLQQGCRDIFDHQGRPDVRGGPRRRQVLIRTEIGSTT